MAVTAPFATASDLEARWRPLSDSETTTANALLSDASDIIMTTCPGWVDATAGTLKRIACAIVKRGMIAGAEAAGLSQHSETVGPVNESFSYANPAGDLYLTAAEKKSLGCGRQESFFVDLGAVG